MREVKNKGEVRNEKEHKYSRRKCCDGSFYRKLKVNTVQERVIFSEEIFFGLSRVHTDETSLLERVSFHGVGTIRKRPSLTSVAYSARMV